MKTKLTNDTNVRKRISVKVDKGEVKEWKGLFSAYGTKREFERQTGVSPMTLNRIIKRGAGTIKIVSAIRAFVVNYQPETV